MSSASRAQLGLKAESTWATPVTVDRFFEFNKEDIKIDYRRTESAGLRSAHRTLRSDRFVPWHAGAKGPVTMEVLSKGFGLLFQHALGSVSTSGPTDSTYTHTCSIGNMKGLGLTVQVNRPFHPGDTDQAFTYAGGKVASGKLYNSVDGMLMLDLGLDFQDVATGTALASASYPSTTQPLSWAGGQVTIGGSNVDVLDVEIGWDNGLKTDDIYLRNSTLKKEPQEAKMREVTFKMTCDFESLTQLNRFASSTASGALAAVVGTWTLVGASTYPSVTATLAAARFDGDPPTVSDTTPLRQTLVGKGLYNGTDSPLVIAYATADSTP